LAFLDASLQTGLVALRESLEAFLLVGILSGVVVKLGFPQARKQVLWGAVAGAVVAVLLGFLAQGVAQRLYEANAVLFEGLASLLAVCILTYMIVWMYRHTRDLMGTLHTRAKAALGAGRPAVLFGLSFVAVVREGLETVLFVAGKLAESPTGAGVGVVVGVGLSALLAYLLFSGVLKLSVQGFFTVTGAILVLVAAGMLVTTVHDLSEPKADGGPGWVPQSAQAIHAHDVLPTECEDGAPTTAACVTGGLLHVLVGWRDDLRVAELAAWALYVAAFALGYGLVRRRKTHPAKAPPAI
jgi:high-affinity iron transporter